ncbi:MAG: hypothetical protein KDB99_08970 [Chitinophagaceae bacterium]|nr:hypothetical protein [Chitinophagaceae bacterium]
MKSILYAGATLMIGASIYGFVDYKNTSHKKEFINMYDEPTKEKVIKETIPVTNETAEVKKQTSLKESKNVTAKKEAVADKPANTKKVVKKDKVIKVKKHKKLDRKIFSRAPIREDIDEEELLPVPSESEIKKIDNKEL